MWLLQLVQLLILQFELLRQSRWLLCWMLSLTSVVCPRIMDTGEDMKPGGAMNRWKMLFKRSVQDSKSTTQWRRQIRWLRLRRQRLLSMMPSARQTMASGWQSLGREKEIRHQSVFRIAKQMPAQSRIALTEEDKTKAWFAHYIILLSVEFG